MSVTLALRQAKYVSTEDGKSGRHSKRVTLENIKKITKCFGCSVDQDI